MTDNESADTPKCGTCGGFIKSAYSGGAKFWLHVSVVRDHVAHPAVEPPTDEAKTPHRKGCCQRPPDEYAINPSCRCTCHQPPAVETVEPLTITCPECHRPYHEPFTCAEWEARCPYAETREGLRERIRTLEQKLTAAEKERDDAIAHDTQPYPTAWAYEQACRARDAWCKLATEANEREQATQSSLRAAEERTHEWSLALQSLTPGGSEYVDDPARCVAFVREARESQHNAIIAAVKARKAAEEKIAALSEGARIMDAAAENTIIALRSEVEQLRGERDSALLRNRLAKICARHEPCAAADQDFAGRCGLHVELKHALAAAKMEKGSE